MVVRQGYTTLTIEALEVFVVHFDVVPLRVVSIAPIPTHDFCYVKLTDSDGHIGWGETYLIPGIASVIRDLAEVVLGRDAVSARRSTGMCGCRPSTPGPRPR